MLQRTLPALLASALWTIGLSPAVAQAKPAKKGAVAKAASEATASGLESEVVGTVNGKPIMTFGQLISKVQKASPPAFAAAIGQVVGQQATTAFFGPKPKSQISFTRVQLLQELRAHPPQALVATLQQELGQEAIRQAGVARHAEPTDAQLDAIVTYLVHKQRLQMGQQVPATVTDDQFIQMLRPGLTRASLKASPNVRIDATMFNLARLDIEKKLKHPVGEGDFIEARHILVKANPLPPTPTPDATRADAEALAKITRIYDDIKAGKVKFDDAAKANSDDPGSKETGGSLGTFMPDGTMDQQFQNVAFSTKSGEISKPFRTQFGYHILQVTKTGKEMRPDERQAFLMDKEMAQSNVIYQEIVASSKIVNKLQPEPTIRIPGGPGGPGGR